MTNDRTTKCNICGAPAAGVRGVKDHVGVSIRCGVDKLPALPLRRKMRAELVASYPTLRGIGEDQR